MNRISITAIALLLLLPSFIFAQNISGKILGLFSGEKEPIVGAVVYYPNSEISTTTNKNGEFQIELLPHRVLVVQYIGFKPDTIRVHKEVYLEITLQSVDALDEIELVERIKSIELNKKSASLEFNIGQKELAKAACCNLSESFETNPAIDASFADAVTGTRQIELLGLAGKYSQIQLEMIPYVRGVSSNYGLTHIPGPWISSMQLSKGAGSVTNGFESMTGQINVELHKPNGGPKLLLNTYANQSGRVELNVVSSQKVTKKWSTVVLGHASSRLLKNDNNNDGFLDMPLSQQFNLVNKWKYNGTNGLESQIGVRILDDKMQGGQMDFDHKNPEGQSDWGSEIKNSRYELFGKIGYILPNQNLSSIGLIYSVYHQDLQSYFGKNQFRSKQNSVYLNLLFQSIIGTTAHKYKIGASWMYDEYDKSFNLPFLPQTDEGYAYDLVNSTPGAFAEYTWNPVDNFSLIAGLRADYNQRHNVFVSPRLHLRYQAFKNTTFRLGAGKGYRMANTMEENLSVLASSRTFRNNFNDILATDGQLESAWNMGLSLVQEFTLNYREGSLVVDYFYTAFQNQLVRDLDFGPQTTAFYMLPNGSTSSTLSVQADYEPLKRLDVRLAYKYQLVETDYLSIGKTNVPLVPKNRVLFNIGYETRTDWKFDLTWNWFDQKRIPSTQSNPIEYQFASISPSHSMFAAQINKTMGKFEVYVGGENLLDFRQNNAIVAADNPYGSYFDSNLVWGPIFGRMFYVGINFKL